MQGRMIYAFSVGYALHKKKEYKKTAEQGVNFLLENFWDEKFGGWFRSVYWDGRVKDTDKHMFDQAYVLIGLTEYYRVTGDKQAFKFINKSYETINANGWDREYEGYYERCSRDWSEISNKKTICVHLDMLAAIMSMYCVEKKKAYLNRLEQIADVIITRMREPKYFCVLETFHKNWVYNPLVSMDKIQFGHQLKCVCLSLELYRLTGNLYYYEFGERIINFCNKFGWDQGYSGFFQHGYRNGKIASREKLWWPQCEGLHALLLMYTITSRESYFDYFKKLTEFCLTFFSDDEYGDWFTSCHNDGTVKDDRKGYEWKAAFHNVQACFNSYRLLKETGYINNSKHKCFIYL